MVIPGQTVVRNLRTCQGFGDAMAGSASLCVVAGVEAIRFAVLEGDDNRCLALGDLRNNTASVSAGLNEQVRSFSTFLDGACEAVPWLCGPFQRRWIAWEGMSSTLVPPSVMTPGERWEYLSFGHRMEAGETVLYDRLAVPDAFNIFSVPERIREMLASRFGVASLFHYSTPLIAGAVADHHRHQGRQALYAWLTERVLDLVLIDRQGLRFHNRFSCSAPEDAIYYMIYVLQQFGVDPEQARVILAGQVTESDRLVTLLGKYVGHPSVMNSVPDIRPCKELAEVPVHAWFPVLNLFRCGS